MMKKYTIIFWLCMLTVCSYRKTDFASVKRHEWRCTKKPNAHSTKSSIFVQRTSQDNIPFIENQMRTNNVDSVKCCFCKKCKGLRGLKSISNHAESSIGINEEMVSANDTETKGIINDNLDDFIVENLMELKPRIKLPKTETGWKEADMYFRSILHAGDINISNLIIFVKNITLFADILGKNLEQLIKSNYKMN